MLSFLIGLLVLATGGFVRRLLAGLTRLERRGVCQAGPDRRLALSALVA